VRYSGQSYAVEIPDPSLDNAPALGEAFRDLHARLYGFATDEPWELVSLRLTVSVLREAGAVMGHAQADGQADERRSDCLFGPDGPIATPRLERGGLADGRTIAGPAIVEDEWSTVVLPPGAALRADARGHLHIDVGSAP